MKVLIFVLSLMFLSAAPLQASGGISGGGGGTTNPNPTEPERVASAVYTNAGPTLLAWIKAAELNFLALSAEEQSQSPLRKLFTQTRTIYDVMRETKVELRFSEPCLDADGNPWDGSMYAVTPGAVCISPFTMAPKLKDSNVKEETMALLIHELSHLLGATEEEAEAIQLMALADLEQNNLMDQMVKPEALRGRLDSTIRLFPTIAQGLEQIHQRDFLSLEQLIAGFRRDLTFDFSLSFAMLRPELRKLYEPNFSRYQLIRLYVCSVDTTESVESRNFCQNTLNQGFQGEASVSARTFLSRAYNFSPGIFAPEYDLVMLDNISDMNGARAILGEAEVFLRQIHAALVEHIATKFDIIRR